MALKLFSVARLRRPVLRDTTVVVVKPGTQPTPTPTPAPNPNVAHLFLPIF